MEAPHQAINPRRGWHSGRGWSDSNGRSNFRDSITSLRDKLKAKHKRPQRHPDILENTGFLVNLPPNTVKGLAKNKQPECGSSGLFAQAQKRQMHRLSSTFFWKSPGPQVHIQHLKTLYERGMQAEMARYQSVSYRQNGGFFIICQFQKFFNKPLSLEIGKPHSQ